MMPQTHKEVRVMDAKSPREHDYTTRHWGHDVAIHRVMDGGNILGVSGWGGGVKRGDYLILPQGEGTTRYQVEHIFYQPDPPDMWSATLHFAPRDAQLRR
jgi:MioC protein